MFECHLTALGLAMAIVQPDPAPDSEGAWTLPLQIRLGPKLKRDYMVHLTKRTTLAMVIDISGRLVGQRGMPTCH